jgi:hypothetical protein
MENVSVLNYPSILNDNFYLTNVSREISPRKKSRFSPTVTKVIAEGGENFFLYLKKLGLSRENNMLALSSVHHYFYDDDELKNVRTIVNLKKLNHINNLEDFLQTLFQMLHHDANFVGCFSNDKTQNQNGLPSYKPSRLLNRFINFIDSKTDRILDINRVSEALKKSGHTIIDMTEIDGVTYFYSKSALTQSN